MAAKQSVPVIVFKKKEIDKMPLAGPGEEILLRDDGSPLRLRIGAKKKTFYVNDRNASGKLIKRNLPHDPASYDLDELREAARAAVAEKDPEIEFAKAGGKVRLLDALELRFAAFGRRSTSNIHGKKDSTKEHYETIIRRYAEDWLDLDMRQITEQMFEVRYNSLRTMVHVKRRQGVPVLDDQGNTIPVLDESGKPKPNKTSAKHFRTYISSLYSFIRENRQDKSFADPTDILKRNKIKETVPRRRFEINTEIAKKFIETAVRFRDERPLTGRKTNQARACTNLILANLFVGMRSGELRRTPISKLILSGLGEPIGFEFDDEYASQNLKTTGRYTVAFSDVLRSIVTDQYDPQNQYLFESNIRDEPISDSSVRPYMKEICDLAGVNRYPLNAMRNFFINLGGRAGINDVEMKHLVNHSTNQNQTDGYAGLKNDFDYLLKNSQKVIDFIMRECGISKTVFGIEQSETNQLQNALDMISKYNPEILKLAFAMYEKSKNN
ncbi:hypothetical protein P3C80_30835 [Pseudomonas aeruginosa]|uniref:hypothetical protein n=1 Tax=Pseudomonas aeruginosa TaxID=287 RepID=UPI0021F1A493|nr:hypothetical protein [Pseudomonas aeruginosa]MCV6104770.1 hypothetical protein [Pseudomonas aeruginosa]MDI2201438.1 hypothetical protein [Pseudomonas aeruginosa]HBO3958473.1 hypothetical protein [Pseudomonas aeruginosa]HCF6078374.1 hypothetical protein [Pseudomonas aeruginosa]HEP8279026.1 hypothetical protein [Pseudomonas aeruginosa]